MRIVDGKHVEWIDEEAVVYDVASGRLHYLNPTAAFFYALVQENGYEQAVNEFETRYGQEDGFKNELQRVIDRMVTEGLLEDE